MKKTSSFHIVCYLITLLMITVACESKPKVLDNGIEIKSIRLEKTYYLFNDTTKPACLVEINFQYPVSERNDSDISKLQSIFIEKCLGNNYKDRSPERALNDYAEDYISNFKLLEVNDEYLTFFEDEDDETDYEEEQEYSYYVKISNDIMLNKSNIISFTVEKTSYEGGAHDSKLVDGYVIDLNNYSLLSESDFEGNSYKAHVSQLLANQIAKDNQLLDSKELENIGYTSLEDIIPNGNFFVNEKGITYIFNVNEIAGTMVGITKVFIPFSELKVYTSKENPLSVLM